MAIMFNEKGDVFTLRPISDEWQPFNVQLRDVVNVWASRTDLLTYAGPDAGRGIAPALYSHTNKEIDLNTDVAFGKGVSPELIKDFRNRTVQFQWIRAAGLALHESMHAQYTTADWSAVHGGIVKAYGKQAKDVWNAFQNLEESRIEKRGVEKFPENRAFLRGSALYLVDLPKVDDEGVKIDYAAAPNIADLVFILSALGMARVDAGVLDRKDVKEISKLISEVIPPATRKTLRRIWREFHELDDWHPDDLKRMVELSKEWVDLLQTARDQNPAPKSGPDEDAYREFLKRFLKAFMEDQSSTGQAAQTEAGEQERTEISLEKLKHKQEESTRHEANKTIADEIFPKSLFDSGRGTTYHNTRSVVVEERSPSLDERKMAVTIAKAFEKAKYRDRIITTQTTARPPGRLNTSLAMQGRAIKAAGGHSTVEPWKSATRKHVEDPSLRLGIMGDISGSMSSTMPAMAVATWVMQEAAYRIQGKVASVYFGGTVFSVLKPGEHQDKVTTFSAPDSSHAFDKAFRALDGALNLLDGEGARLLIINSDGNYGQDELKAVIKWLKLCKAKGVAVVWLGLRHGDNEELCTKTGATYVPVNGGSVLAAAEAIGKACTQALTGASRG
jgi:hypothetical protein